VSYEVFIAVYIEVRVLWVVLLVVWWLDTNVSEDRAASILRVEVRGQGDISIALLPLHRGSSCMILRFPRRCI